MAAVAEREYLTTGEAAVRLGAREWRVARLYQRGLLPEPRRLGRARLIPASDLPRLRDALMRAGYLQRGAEDGDAG
jgi:excisionase family DNA binding protein